MFYNNLLFVHNSIRWLVLLAALWALVRAYSGWFGRRPWMELDRRAGLAFSITFDVQLLLGLLLAILSPLIRAAMTDFSSAMVVPEIRSILIEHLPLMVVALVIVHVTSVLARKVPDDQGKHRRAAIGYTLATIVILVAIPWWRPLLRGIG